MPDNKEVYRQLCETEGSGIPLFQQYWWMDTVCRGKRWDVILCFDGDRVVGSMPFLYGSRLGMKYIVQPQLTPWCGPWVRQGIDGEAKQAVLARLADGLRDRKALLLMQNFPPETTDALPFTSRGFRSVSRFTYRFLPIPEPSTLRSVAAKERRKGVDVVENTYSLDRQVGVEEFADFHIAYWERRSGRDLLGREFILRVCNTALSRGQGMLYGLRNQDGTLMASRFVVFDDRCAYSLLSALHADALRNSMTLLVWKMIEDLYECTQAFDFEGGMDPGIGHFYHSFGTEQTPILCIYRSLIPCGKKLLHL